MPFLRLWFYHCGVFYLVMSTAKTTGDAEHDTVQLTANVQPVLHGWCISHQQEDMRFKTLKTRCSCYPESWLYLVRYEAFSWTSPDTKNESCSKSTVFGGCRTSQWVKIALPGPKLLLSRKSYLYGVVPWKSWVCGPRHGTGEWCSVCSCLGLPVWHKLVCHYLCTAIAEQN